MLQLMTPEIINVSNVLFNCHDVPVRQMFLEVRFLLSIKTKLPTQFLKRYQSGNNDQNLDKERTHILNRPFSSSLFKNSNNLQKAV